LLHFILIASTRSEKFIDQSICIPKNFITFVDCIFSFVWYGIFW